MNAANIVKVNIYAYVCIYWVVISNGFFIVYHSGKCLKATDSASFFGTPLLILYVSLACKFFYSFYRDLDYPL